MTRKNRVALWLGLVGVGCAVAPFLAFGVDGWNLTDYIASILMGFLLLSPTLLVMLPMILLFERMSVMRSLLFVCVGSISGALVLNRETILFFNTARANRFPDHPWFAHQFECVAACAAVVCAIYVIGVRSIRPAASSSIETAK